MECPWDRALNWAWGWGPSKVGPMSRPRGTIETVSRMLDHASTLVCAVCSQLYSGKLGSRLKRLGEVCLEVEAEVVG